MVREAETLMMEANLCETFRPSVTMLQITAFPFNWREDLWRAFGLEKHVGTNISFLFVHENRVSKPPR